ncbi:MAG TPA: DUF4359 domain-containing protein [Limnochordia bacterium]
MIRRLLGLLIALAVGLLLAATNPSTSDFHHYFRDTIVAEARRSAGGRALVGLSDALSRIVGVDAVDAYVDRLLAGLQRADFLLFSVYSLDVEGERHLWVGACRRFVRLQ